MVCQKFDASIPPETKSALEACETKEFLALKVDFPRGTGTEPPFDLFDTDAGPI